MKSKIRSVREENSIKEHFLPQITILSYSVSLCHTLAGHGCDKQLYRRCFKITIATLPRIHVCGKNVRTKHGQKINKENSSKLLSHYYFTSTIFCIEHTAVPLLLRRLGSPGVEGHTLSRTAYTITAHRIHVGGDTTPIIRPSPPPHNPHCSFPSRGIDGRCLLSVSERFLPDFSLVSKLSVLFALWYPRSQINRPFR